MYKTRVLIGVISLFLVLFIPISDVKAAENPKPEEDMKAADPYTLFTAEVVKGANIWLPSTIIVQKGSEVSITLKNLSEKEHGFAVDRLGTKEILPAGKVTTITLKPTASGTLKYYCPLHPGHIGGQLLIQ